MKTLPWITTIILFIALLGLLALNRFIKEQNTLQAVALNNEVTTWKDKAGIANAKVIALESSETKLFTDLSVKDSAISKLQLEVKEAKKLLKEQGSVSNFSTITSIDTVFKTIVIADTLNPKFPIYKSSFNLLNWVYGSMLASKDSIALKLTIHNQYSVLIGRDPQGFLGLGKSVPFAQVKNFNPYSETTELKTYVVSLPKPKRFGIGPFIGLGWIDTLSPEILIGVGVQYNFIRF